MKTLSSCGETSGCLGTGGIGVQAAWPRVCSTEPWFHGMFVSHTRKKSVSWVWEILSYVGILNAGSPRACCQCASPSRHSSSILFELHLEGPGALDENKKCAQTRVSLFLGAAAFLFSGQHTDSITEFLGIRILPFFNSVLPKVSVVAVRRGPMSPTSTGCCACLSLKEPSLGCVGLLFMCWLGQGHPGQL